MFPNEGGQKHLVRDTKGQLNSKEKDGYRGSRIARSHEEERETNEGYFIRVANQADDLKVAREGQCPFS